MTSVAVPCSPATQGLSAPVGKAHCLWQMKNSRGNRGQQPPTNQFVIAPRFLGIALQPAWRSVHGGHKLSLSQVTFLSRKVWKPSSLTLTTQDPLPSHLLSKWCQMRIYHRPWELLGNIWGQSGRATQMLGFGAAPSENDGIGLEKSGVWFSSNTESHLRSECPVDFCWACSN